VAIGLDEAVRVVVEPVLFQLWFFSFSFSCDFSVTFTVIVNSMIAGITDEMDMVSAENYSSVF
jgi:hypothetical protein